MKVGDLIKQTYGKERTGIIVAEVPCSWYRKSRRLFKVLWDTPTISGSLTGPLWESQAELINESR